MAAVSDTDHGASEKARGRTGGQRRAAVFLDRDGTIMNDAHYLADPSLVVLVDGAGTALARMRAAGYALVVITNQSGIARGLITNAEYETVRQRLDRLLAAHGAVPDATYMCPHHPDHTGPCECRKPGTALFALAARELGLDLARSVLIGDRWRDIVGAAALGAHGILVPGAETPEAEIAQAAAHAIVEVSLSAAADRIAAL